MPDYLTNLLRRPPVGWWDVLDIAIVSLLIYEFLKLIRGTRAVQMALGSFLIVTLFYVSRLAPLQTLNWLIRNALVYVAFAAIVIFQSDIRRALRLRAQRSPCRCRWRSAHRSQPPAAPRRAARGAALRLQAADLRPDAWILRQCR